jgi:hypothetical protein
MPRGVVWVFVEDKTRPMATGAIREFQFAE